MIGEESIIGAGAVGTYFGVRLAALGHDVRFLVRKRPAAPVAMAPPVARKAMASKKSLPMGAMVGKASAGAQPVQPS